MTFIQAAMRQKQGPESIHRPKNGRRSAPGLNLKRQMVTLEIIPFHYHVNHILA